MPRIIEGVQDRILDAAQAIFEQGGFAEADMRSIAETAGIAVGTLYNHYSGRDALLVQMLLRIWRQVVERIEWESALPGPPRDRLRAVMLGLIAAMDQGQGMGMRLAEAIVAQGQAGGALDIPDLRRIREQAAAVFSLPLFRWAAQAGRALASSDAEPLSRLLLAMTWEIHEMAPPLRERALELSLRLPDGFFGTDRPPRTEE